MSPFHEKYTSIICYVLEDFAIMEVQCFQEYRMLCQAWQIFMTPEQSSR